MRKYEVMFILDPRLDTESIKDEIKKLIQEQNGEILEEKDMGVQKLAYSIRKRDRGFYYLVNVKLDPLKNEVLKRELNLKEPVIRYMFVRKES